MEPTVQGRTEKSFSYVVSAPGSDGFDVVNVDVKIDTRWVFQDVEESGKEQEYLTEGVASIPDVDAGQLREQLESSEQKLLAAVDKYLMSESGLRSRVQELQLSERRLLQKVDELSTLVAQERSASLRAQEQLRALQGEMASWVQEAERVARRQRWRLRRRDQALAQQAAALERCGRTQREQLGLVREQERVLRAQVQRLERDVRRLGRAAGLLLAQLHAADRAPGSGSPCSQVRVPEATELRALRARAERRERERAEAERRLREQRAKERWLRELVEELRCCVFGLTLSEIGLQGQVEELAQQKQRLQSQLRVQAPAAHGSLGFLGCAQGESPSLPRMEAGDPCRSQGHHNNIHGVQASADRLSEGPCSSVGDGPYVVVPGSGTMHELQGDLAGSERGQGAPVESCLDEQILLLLCGCPPDQCMDERLFLHLARVPERLMVTPAQEPFLLAQKSTFPLWGADGKCEPLLPPLLQKPSQHELQTREVQDSRALPAPRAMTYPGQDCSWARSHDNSLGQESSNTSNGSFPRKGLNSPRDMWKEGSGSLAARVEQRDTIGTLVMQVELCDPCQAGRESSENLSLGSGIQAPEGVPQEVSGALDTQTTAHCPWPQLQCPVLSLQGMASGLQEGPKSLNGRRKVERCGWGFLSSKEEVVPMVSSSRAHRIRESWPNCGQLPARKGQDILRRVQDKEGHQSWFGDGLLLQEEHSGDDGQEEEKKMGHGVVPSLEQPDCEAHGIVGEQDVSQFPKWTAAGARGEAPSPSGTLSTGPDRCVPQIDELEREVEMCFWQMNTLKLGSGGGQQMPILAGESWNLSLTGQDNKDGMGHHQALASQRPPDACSAEDAESRDGGEGGGLEENVALDTGKVLPGTAPDGAKAGLGSVEVSRSQLSSPCGALERTRGSFHQLLATLKKERNQFLCDNTGLRGDQERCHCDMCHLKKEGLREAARTWRLEQANLMLQGELGQVRQELDQCLQAFSDLEDCNGKSYSRISQLEEENEKLKADLHQLQKALSESVRKARSRMGHVALENEELRALISELGVSYKELIKDVVQGIEDMVRGLQGENRHLLHRVRGLEQEVAWQMNRERGHWGEGRHSQGDTKMAGDKECTDDKEVQATPLLGQLITRACGSPLDEEAGMIGGPKGPSSDSEGSRCKTDANTPSLAWRVAEVPRTLQEHIDGGGKDTQLENEGRPWVSVEQGQTLRSLSHGPQLQGSEAVATEEDPSLCVQRLRHQVQTLQCQLRDQGSALWQLQEARDEALGLQAELKGKPLPLLRPSQQRLKEEVSRLLEGQARQAHLLHAVGWVPELEELREQQQEARLAMSPLKAKLASLVHKCQERNRLIAHLMWEMPRHGPENLLLSRLAQDMLNDMALTEYAATFLSPGVPETSYYLNVDPEGTAARGAQECLLDSKVDPVMQTPLDVESWPRPEAEWDTQTDQLDSLKLIREEEMFAVGGE